MVTVKLGDEIFRFSSYSRWVDKAASWFKNSGLRNGVGYVCVDTKGRVCQIGKHFARAREEDSFPVVVYSVDDDPEVEPADETWIRDRWGGFTYLVIGRNEDFMLDFVGGGLWLHYENDSRESPVGRILLFKDATKKNVIDAELMFGCRD